MTKEERFRVFKLRIKNEPLHQSKKRLTSMKPRVGKTVTQETYDYIKGLVEAKEKGELL